MAVIADVREAGEHLEEWIDRAAKGETMMIAIGGELVAYLAPYPAKAGKTRRPGYDAGQAFIAPDFDDPLEELEDKP